MNKALGDDHITVKHDALDCLGVINESESDQILVLHNFLTIGVIEQVNLHFHFQHIVTLRSLSDKNLINWCFVMWHNLSDLIVDHLLVDVNSFLEDFTAFGS